MRISPPFVVVVVVVVVVAAALSPPLSTTNSSKLSVVQQTDSAHTHTFWYTNDMILGVQLNLVIFTGCLHRNYSSHGTRARQ